MSCVGCPNVKGFCIPDECKLINPETGTYIPPEKE